MEITDLTLDTFKNINYDFEVIFNLSCTCKHFYNLIDFDISLKYIKDLGLDLAIYLAHSDIKQYQKTLSRFPSLQPTIEYTEYLSNKKIGEYGILSYLCAIHFGLVNEENKKYTLYYDDGFDDDSEYLYKYSGNLIKYFGLLNDDCVHSIYDYFMFRAQDENTRIYIRNNWKHIVPQAIGLERVYTLVNDNDCIEVLINL